MATDTPPAVSDRVPRRHDSSTPSRSSGGDDGKSEVGEPVKRSRDLTNIAVLGFSSSGKTVYLTMLFYLTHELGFSSTPRLARAARREPFPWRADWLSLDGGKTYAYLMALLREILGVNQFGDLQYKDKTTKREVIRRFPAGTQTQTELRFRLFYHNGIREHELNILTLETKGEVQQLQAASPSQMEGDVRAQWLQVSKHCSGSSAVLLFFNLLTMGDKKQAGHLRTLVGTLMGQANKPKAVAIVITGADILRPEQIDQTKEMFAAEYRTSLEELAWHGVAYEIFLISSVGRDFTRKKADGLSDACRNHHRCALCQELDPDPKKKPDPKDVTEPWKFIYENVHRRHELLDRVLVLRDAIRKRRAALVAACAVALLLGVGAFYVRAQQKERDIAALLNRRGMTSERLQQLLALDRALTRDDSLRWFVTDPANLPPGDPRAQLHVLARAAEIFDDDAAPLPARIAAAQDVASSGRLPAELKNYAERRLRELRFTEEEEKIRGLSAGDFTGALKASDEALEKSRSDPEETRKINLAATELIGRIANWADGLRVRLDSRMQAKPLRLSDDASQYAALETVLGQLQLGATGRRLEAQPVRAGLAILRDDYARILEFNQFDAMPEGTLQQIVEKRQKFVRFRTDYPAHPLARAALIEDIRLLQNEQTSSAAQAFASLSKFDPASATGNLPLFAETMEGNRAFLANRAYRESDEAAAVKLRLSEMDGALRAELPRLTQHATRVLAGFGAASPPPLPNRAEAEKEEQDSLQQAEAMHTLARAHQADPAFAAELEKTAGMLDRVHDVQRQYATLARLKSNAEPGNYDAAISALGAFARTLDPDHPARRLAEAERNRFEDEGVLKQMQDSSSNLAPPADVPANASDKLYREVLAYYDSYLRVWDERLAAPGRAQRFEAFVASLGQKSPLEEHRRDRNLLKARFDEQTIWNNVKAALADPMRKKTSEEILAWIGDYQARFKDSPRLDEMAKTATAVKAWRADSFRFGLDRINLPRDSGWVVVTVTLKVAGTDSVVAEPRMEVLNGTVAKSDGTDATVWNDLGYRLELDVRRKGAAEAMYASEREIAPGRFAESLANPFSNGACTVKLGSLERAHRPL